MIKSKTFKHYLKELRHWLRQVKPYIKSKSLVSQLKEILPAYENNIPVIVISYNNGIYVDNTCKQLEKYNIKPIVIDNNSTCKKTLGILRGLEKTRTAHIARSSHNFGHEVGFIEPLYKILPEVFAYTDPDLQFNKNLPEDFLERLSQLTIEFPVFKAGFALSLNPKATFKKTTVRCHHSKPIHYDKTLSIKEFEEKHWVYRLQHNELELYASPIDTTFAVYRKQNYIGDFHRAIRVAGDYSAIHLPWFVELDIMNEIDRDSYNKGNNSSNWSR